MSDSLLTKLVAIVVSSQLNDDFFSLEEAQNFIKNELNPNGMLCQLVTKELAIKKSKDTIINVTNDSVTVNGIDQGKNVTHTGRVYDGEYVLNIGGGTTKTTPTREKVKPKYKDVDITGYGVGVTVKNNYCGGNLNVTAMSTEFTKNKELVDAVERFKKQNN